MSTTEARRGLNGLEQRVLARLRALDLPSGTTLLLGFSGGPDSLALGAILARVAARAGVNVVALHVDHGLRASAAAEQDQAQRLAAAVGLPFRRTRLPDQLRSVHPGVGLEEAARRERYLAFARFAVSEEARLLALAHHQDDQAETVLLHLLRGAGLSGAAGMAELTEIAVPWWSTSPAIKVVRLRLWRPLLDEPRSRLRTYLAERALAGIEDPSNADLDMRRNAVRAVALPALKAVHPEAPAALARFARLAAEEDALLESMAAGATDRALDDAGGLSRAALREAPPALRRRMVRRWLARMTDGLAPTADRVDAVVAKGIARAGGWRIEVGEGWSVVALAGRLWAGRDEELRRRAAMLFAAPLFPDGTSPTVRVAVPGTATVGHHRIELSRIPATDWDVAPESNVVNLPSFGDSAVLRSPKPGDRWAISGRKVGDWLTGQGVPAMIRSRLVCLTTDRGVHWIAGLPLPSFERGEEVKNGVTVGVRRVEG